MSERIRVTEATYARLESLRAEDETFDDVISRLFDERRRRVPNGAGYWRTVMRPRARDGLEPI